MTLDTDLLNEVQALLAEVIERNEPADTTEGGWQWYADYCLHEVASRLRQIKFIQGKRSSGSRLAKDLTEAKVEAYVELRRLEVEIDRLPPATREEVRDDLRTVVGKEAADAWYNKQKSN